MLSLPLFLVGGGTFSCRARPGRDDLGWQGRGGNATTEGREGTGRGEAPSPPSAGMETRSGARVRHQALGSLYRRRPRSPPEASRRGQGTAETSATEAAGRRPASREGGSSTLQRALRCPNRGPNRCSGGAADCRPSPQSQACSPSSPSPGARKAALAAPPAAPRATARRRDALAQLLGSEGSSTPRKIPTPALPLPTCILNYLCPGMSLKSAGKLVLAYAAGRGARCSPIF